MRMKPSVGFHVHEARLHISVPALTDIASSGSEFNQNSSARINNVSSAVVDVCCRLFADRRFLDGSGCTQPVISYSDLIAHLLQKSKRSAQYLAFEGMNQVVSRQSLE